MRLRFLQGSEIVVRFPLGLGEDAYRGFLFNPEGDIPDALGKRILGNKQHEGKFEVVGGETKKEPKPEFLRITCDVCGREFTRHQALGAHKRVHSKDKQT